MNEFSKEALNKNLLRSIKIACFYRSCFKANFFGKNELVAIGKELCKGFLQGNYFQNEKKFVIYDAILSQGHLMVVRVPCDMRKDSFIDTPFEMNKFPKKEPINFCKFYYSEGATQLLLRVEHLTNLKV